MLVDHAAESVTVPVRLQPFPLVVVGRTEVNAVASARSLRRICTMNRPTCSPSRTKAERMSLRKTA